MYMVVENEGVFFMDSSRWTDEEAAALMQLHIDDGATPEDARRIVKGWYAELGWCAEPPQPLDDIKK